MREGREGGRGVRKEWVSEGGRGVRKEWVSEVVREAGERGRSG